MYDLSKVWMLDIETDGLLPTVSKITTAVFINCKDISKKYVFRFDREGSIDKSYQLLLKILEHKDTYIAGHNISNFDLPVYAKLYSLDILKYYNKVIDTIHLSALMFPKHKLSKHPLNRNLPYEFKHLNDSHSLNAWSYRLNPKNTKIDYKGLSEGIYMELSEVNNKDEIYKLLEDNNVMYSKKYNVIKVPSKAIEAKLLDKGVKLLSATKKQLELAKWEVFDIDELTSYNIQDVKVNIMLLRYFLKQEYIPSKKVQKLEIYNSLLAGYQSIYGWKIDIKKLQKLESKLTLQLKKIDLQLEGMFEPYFKLEKKHYNSLWNHLFTLYKELNLNRSFEDIKNDSSYIEYISKKSIELQLTNNPLEDIIDSMTKGLNSLVYTTRNTSIWVPVNKNIPNSVGKYLCSKLEYTKTGKPKAIKAWEKMLKYDEDEGIWYRKVNVTKTNLRDDIKLEHFKAGSRKSILDFMYRKYKYIPNVYTNTLNYKLDADLFEKLPYKEAPILTERFRVFKQISQVNTIKDNLINGRLHATTNVVGTNTYRTTSTNPNLAQIDTRQHFRELFIADNNMIIIGADQSGMEITMLGEFLIPFDNRRMQNIKANEDVHQSNSDIVGISRKDVKSLFFATLYGSSGTLTGHTLWKEEYFNKYAESVTNDEFNEVWSKLRNRCEFYNGKHLYPLEKNTRVELSPELIYKTIYGTEIQSKLKDGIIGYNELVNHLITVHKGEYIDGLDGRRIYLKSKHSALNYLLQSSNAVYSKYWIYFINEILRRKGYKLGKDYIPLISVYDEYEIECREKIVEDVKTTYYKAAELANKALLDSIVEIDVKQGDSWWDVH